ncbi:MAG: Calx-beta domain-containing protein [Rubripirellula sp.]
MSFTPLMLQRTKKRKSKASRGKARNRRRLGLQTLEDRRLLAAQVINAIPSTDAVAFEDTFTVDLQYSVTNPLPDGPVLFGLHVHYDSSEIQFVDQANVLPDGLVAVEDREETLSDSDPNTDRVWTVSFVDVVNGFPLPTTPLPASLATLTFQALRRPGLTPLNFTADTSAGYDFDATSIAINVTQPTFTVNSGDDTPTAGELTLREAVTLANAASEPAIIDFAPGVSTVSVTGSSLTLSNDVSIVGPRADQLTLSAADNDRLFNVASGATVDISGVTLSDGNTREDGGAIFNEGTLILDGVRLIDNVAAGAGGGIASLGNLVKISNSELSGNQANGASGGAIQRFTGAITIVNSTISGNSALSDGGGIATSGSTTTLRNTTVAFNQAGLGGAGLFSFTSASVFNSIIVGNTIAGVVEDVAGTVNASNSVIGGVATQVIDANLEFAGAPTRTHNLVSGGPAINTGNSANALSVDGFQLFTDQRGRARIVGPSVDAGAVEFSPPAGMMVLTPDGTSINEGDSANLSVVLLARPATSVVVGFATNNPSEASPRFDRVVFGPGNWDTPQLVPIDAPDDSDFDGDDTSTIIVSVVDEDSDDFYDSVGSQSFTFTTIDDEGLGIIVTPTSGLTTSEDQSTASFTVVLDKAPSANVTVPLTSSNPNEGLPSASSLTFTPQNFGTAQTVTVTGVNDNVVDGDASYSIVIGAASSSDDLYDGFDPPDVSLLNTDNDVVGITVTPLSGLSTNESGSTATFSVVLDSLPSTNVSIAISSDNINEGTVSTSLLTFTSTNGLIPQIVTVTGVDDQSVDGEINFNIITGTATSDDPNYNGIDPANVSVANADNDIAGIVVTPVAGLNTTEGGGTATFTVALQSLPTSDVTIAITSDNTDEGTVSTSLLTFTSSNGTTPQTVTITGVDDAAVVDGTVSYSVVTGTASSADTNYNGIDPPDVAVTNADNDLAGITLTPIAGLQTNEGGGSATFTVALNTLPSADVTIALSSSDTGEGTLSTSSLTFTSSDGTTPQTVTVTGVDDDIIDGAIAFSIITAAAVSADANYSGTNPPDVALINSDDDAAGISVIGGPLTVSEGGGTATFSVALNSLPTENVTIGISSSDTNEGTVSTSFLTFTSATGMSPQSVTVTGIDDNAVDGDVSFSIVIGASTSDDPNYNGIDADDLSATNADNDLAMILVTPSSTSTSESGGSSTFTVALSSLPTSEVTIQLSSNDVSEGSLSTSSLTFTPNNGMTPQTVTVTGVDDQEVDGDVSFNITTGSAVSDDAAYAGINPDDVTLTNTDNDTAGIIVTPTAGLSTSEAGGTATFTVALDTLPAADVTIAITSDNVNEGAVSTSLLTFTSINGTTPQTVTITGVDDGSVADGHLAYSIITGVASSLDANYDGIDPDNVAVINADNDTVGIFVTPASGLLTSESGDVASFDVTLTTLPTEDVTIAISSSNPNEGTVSTSLLTFTSTNGTSPQTVTVTGVDDGSIVDGDTVFSIVTAASSSDDTNYNGIDPIDVEVTNQDNDLAGVTISPVSGLTTTEAGGTATFTVSLDTLPSSDVSISLNNERSDEGTLSTTTLTFTSSNGTTPQTVTVTGVDDDLIDGDLPFVITTSATISSDANYDGLDVTDVSVTNLDDDVAEIIVSPTSGLTTSESGGTATFTVSLGTLPSADVRIMVSSDDPGEGTLASEVLTFTRTNGLTPQTVTITGADDSVVDGTATYNIVTQVSSADANYSQLNPADVVVTNTDNDVAGITVTPTSGLSTSEAGGTASFTVALNSLPTDDVTIAISSDNISEGTTSTSLLTFTSTNGTTPQTVTITGVDDGAVADGHLVYSIITGAASSTDPNYNGIDASDVSVTNADDDTVGVIVSPAAGLTTTESGGTATFNVSLTTLPNADVTIALSSDNLSEGTVGLDTLVFTSTNGTDPQTVTVTGVDDQSFDGDKLFSILLGAAVSSDTAYNGFDPVDVAVTNQDNDVPGITVTPTSGLTTTEAGGSATFTVNLDTLPAGDVVISLSSDDESEGTITPATLTFSSTNGTTPQTLTVSGVDDDEIDNAVGYTIRLQPVSSTDLNYDGIDPADVTVVNSDNDDLTSLDFGDLADPSFPTLLANDGARHSVGSLILGGTIDAEADGQPSAFADGDTDDGLTLSATLVAGSEENLSNLMVDASSAGRLDAWIDFNGNGSFETEEHLGGGTSIDVTAGRNVIPFTIASGSTAGTAAARFRLSTTGGLAPTGLAADGEVEDYLLEIVDAASTPDIDLFLHDQAISLRVVDNQLIASNDDFDLFRAPIESLGSIGIEGSDANTAILLNLSGGLPTNVLVAGGAGMNTLAFVGAGDLDFSNGDIRAVNFALLDLRDPGANQITVDAATVSSLSPTGLLEVAGGSNDNIRFADANDWRMGQTSIVDGVFSREVTNMVGGERIRTDLPNAYKNAIRASDVNNNGSVTAGDALVVINELARRAFSDSATQVLTDPLMVAEWPNTYYDQNGDDRVTALDALRVINELASLPPANGEGELIAIDETAKDEWVPASEPVLSSIMPASQTLKRCSSDVSSEPQRQSTNSESSEEAEPALSTAAVDELLSSMTFNP